MADLFGNLGNLGGGLGGLMKGLSNFMPADDPGTQLLKLPAEGSSGHAPLLGTSALCSKE